MGHPGGDRNSETTAQRGGKGAIDDCDEKKKEKGVRELGENDGRWRGGRLPG